MKLGKYTGAIANSLLHFQQLLKKYLKSNGRIPDIEVMNKAGMQSAHAPLKPIQFKWAGNAM